MTLKVGDVRETRDGGSVRIVATDRKSGSEGPRPIVGLYTAPSGSSEIPLSYGLDGHFYDKFRHAYDIMPRKTRVERWVNIYRYADGDFATTTPYKDRASAESIGKRTNDVSVAYVGTFPFVAEIEED